MKIIFIYPISPSVIKSNENTYSTDNLCLSFPSANGKLQILNSVNFSLYENETVALVGPSGSGKSSLLMLLGGLEESDTAQL